jgi:hypothetical protein
MPVRGSWPMPAYGASEGPARRSCPVPGRGATPEPARDHGGSGGPNGLGEGMSLCYSAFSEGVRREL